MQAQHPRSDLSTTHFDSTIDSSFLIRNSTCRVLLRLEGPRWSPEYLSANQRKEILRVRYPPSLSSKTCQGSKYLEGEFFEFHLLENDVSWNLDDDDDTRHLPITVTNGCVFVTQPNKNYSQTTRLPLVSRRWIFWIALDAKILRVASGK